MYLYQWHCYVANGRWREFMRIMTRVNELHEQRGYVKMRFYGGVTGRANFFMAQARYPTLAAWEEEMNRMHQDADLMDALRSTVEYMATTEIHELFQEAPEIA